MGSGNREEMSPRGGSEEVQGDGSPEEEVGPLLEGDQGMKSAGGCSMQGIGCQMLGAPKHLGVEYRGTIRGKHQRRVSVDSASGRPLSVSGRRAEKVSWNPVFFVGVGC